MMKHAGAISLLLFSCLAFAADPPPGDSCMVSSLKIGSFQFVTVALALVSIAIALAYMYSKIREEPVVGVWAKDEASNLLISVFMFSGIIAFVTGACALSVAYVGGDPFDVSQNYLNELTTNNGLNVLSTLTRQSIDNQERATQYLYLGVSPFYGEGVGRAASYRALSAQKELAIDIYLPILASLNAQKYILQGIQWVSLSILLPFAFVLRIIPFTREFGNTLLALFFAMYIIIPSTYAMSAQTFKKISADPIVCIDCAAHNFNTYGLDGTSATGKETVLYRMGITIPQAIFLPNLVLIITITATMAISKALRALAV